MLDFTYAQAAVTERDQLDGIEAATAASTARNEQFEHDLIKCNMGLADAIARRFRGSVGDPQDIRQVALLGLVKAVQRFDPDRGFPFAAFAAPTIAGEIKRYLRDTAWSVRPPRAVQELAVTLVGVVPELRQTLGHEPTPTEIAEHLDLDVPAVNEAINGAHGMFAASLDSLVEGHAAVINGADDPAQLVGNRLELRSAIADLREVDQRILYMRFAEGRNQREIAAELGMSQMQVSRAVAKILATLREVLSDPDSSEIAQLSA